MLRDAGTKTLTDFEQRIAFIIEGAQNLELLIDRLAAYSLALETSASSFHHIRTDVLLRGALAKLEQPLREKGAEVTYDALPRIQGHPDRLMQVFEELIRNALFHRDEPAPKVHISAARQNGHWLFCIRDSGPGVEAADLERIFLPFERLRGNGPGMGLAICRAIVEAHGGRIWAETVPGSGFEIRFTLPS
jgi:signal transduction histidine kinase